MLLAKQLSSNIKQDHRIQSYPFVNDRIVKRMKFVLGRIAEHSRIKEWRTGN